MSEKLASPRSGMTSCHFGELINSSISVAKRSIWPALALNKADALKRCRKGAAAVEFALVGFFAIELIIEVMQAGFYFYVSAAVERATSKASRQIMTGAVNRQNYNASQFMTSVLCPPIQEINLSCSNVISNVQTASAGVSPGGFYAFVNSAKTGLIQPALDNTRTSFCTGTAQSYVFIQILYAMPVFSPIWRAVATNFKGTPSFIVQSTAAFRSEPFPPSSQGC